MARRSTQPYSEEDRKYGLMAVASCNASPTKAAAELKRQGRPISSRTLHRWMKSHPDEYMDARQQASERVWGIVSDQWRTVVEEAADGAKEAVELSRAAMREGDDKKAKVWAATGKDLSVVGGVATDKAGGIEGRPTQVYTSRSANLPELLKRLDKFSHVVKVNPVLVEGTAQEVSQSRPIAALGASTKP